VGASTDAAAPDMPAGRAWATRPRSWRVLTIGRGLVKFSAGGAGAFAAGVGRLFSTEHAPSLVQPGAGRAVW
jgi:hypothetical protein